MARVLLVVGIRVHREALAALLDARDDLIVVASAPSAHDALTALETTSPDVVLAEFDLSDLPDLSAALAERSPRVPLVALGTCELETDVLACAEMGIAACVERNATVEEAAAALTRAAGGEVICSPRTAGLLVRRLSELAADRRPAEPSVAALTRREREVASLMCEDLSNKEIATRLHIEVATVKNHVHSVLAKLRVQRRADATRLLARSLSRAPVARVVTAAFRT